MLFLPRVRNLNQTQRRWENIKYSFVITVYSVIVSTLCIWLLMKSNIDLGLSNSYSIRNKQSILKKLPNCPYWFAGGSSYFLGSCWCGSDEYCMCTPSLAIDAVVEIYDESDISLEGIALVRRKDNGKYALVGGFVEIGETVEMAVHREIFEETGLLLSNLTLFDKIYSEPSRDTRRHTVSIVYVVKASGVPKAGDDAAEIEILSLKEVEALSRRGEDSLNSLHFDHSTIVQDYIRQYHHSK